ncbi:MAG: hypothetical protein JWR90_948 [Marmoricola sp.]|nr:hypothetical protein [Marmoricola sp.]
MGNVTLPTPVFLAGGALCVVAGILVGSVLNHDSAGRSTAQVVSFDQSTSRLCLKGDVIKDKDGADATGKLCGTLRSPSSRTPSKGDDFSFYSIRSTGELNGKSQSQVVIIGDVVD